MPEDENINPERPEYRSSREAIAHLVLEGAAVTAPFIAPIVHDQVGKFMGPKDEGPKTVLPPGVHIDED